MAWWSSLGIPCQVFLVHHSRLFPVLPRPDSATPTWAATAGGEGLSLLPVFSQQLPAAGDEQMSERMCLNEAELATFFKLDFKMLYAGTVALKRFCVRGTLSNTRVLASCKAQRLRRTGSHQPRLQAARWRLSSVAVQHLWFGEGCPARSMCRSSSAGRQRCGCPHLRFFLNSKFDTPKPPRKRTHLNSELQTVGHSSLEHSVV